MRNSRLIGAVAAAAVLVMLAITVVIATSNSAPANTPVKSVTVDAGPLKTATGELTYSDSTGLNVSVGTTFDFVRSQASLAATASLSIAAITTEVRFFRATAYVADDSFSSLTGAPWVIVHMPSASNWLARTGEFLRLPDTLAPRARREIVITKNGVTVTTLDFGTIAVPSTRGLPLHLPASGHLVVIYTVGAQGQLLTVTARIVGHTETSSATFRVTSYNAIVEISRPSSGDTVVLTKKRARDIFGTNSPAVLRVLARIGSIVP